MCFKCFFVDAKKKVSERVLSSFFLVLGGPRVPMGLQNGCQNDTTNDRITFPLLTWGPEGSRGAIWGDLGLMLTLLLRYFDEVLLCFFFFHLSIYCDGFLRHCCEFAM